MRSDLDRVCENKGLRATFSYGEAKGPGWDNAAHNWRVVLRYKRRQLTTDFFGGEAVTDPTAADVIGCLLMDASGIDAAQGFEDWASEYGFDTDSRSAERIYKACAAMAPRLHQLLADDFEAFAVAEH